MTKQRKLKTVCEIIEWMLPGLNEGNMYGVDRRVKKIPCLIMEEILENGFVRSDVLEADDILFSGFSGQLNYGVDAPYELVSFAYTLLMWAYQAGPGARLSGAELILMMSDFQRGRPGLVTRQGNRIVAMLKKNAGEAVYFKIAFPLQDPASPLLQAGS